MKSTGAYAYICWSILDRYENRVLLEVLWFVIYCKYFVMKFHISDAGAALDMFLLSM